MPEIKNNFLSSKMNQDIDDRLMPNNEYRYALNLEVNRSESSNVGTLQNILGNSLAVDFNAVADTSGLECIGVLTDDSNNNIYVFLTNYGGTVYSETAENYIYVYNNIQNVTTLLVSGAWLNFSTQFPIYGINLVENLLFWTDNRNQPRRINVQRASTNVNYYINEEQISVAKLSPLYTPELFRESELQPTLSISASAAVGTVSPASPYTATITLGTPILSNLLREGMIVYATAGTSSFTNGRVTSVTISGPNVTSFVVSNTIIFTSGNISLLYINQYETTMYDVVSEFLPDGTDNPYLIDPYPGDPAYLESRYVRFSYRYKFEDGEYSIMAPFTQIAYIPKQDGYFLYSADPAVNDEESAYRSTIVNFMQNKVNNILLQIILPCPANEVNSLYKIVEIEVLYKEADAIAVSVVDSIPTIPITLAPGQTYFWNTNELVYSYNYQSKKPFKTLPQRDVIRVNDIVPVRALSQEVVGNRVIYGNYQDKFSYPKYLDYNVGASPKFDFGFLENQGTSIVEYPNHSVKENRNYQVGVVLCDKFGRQSGVILSDLIENATSGSSTFGASSLYIPYTGPGDILPSTWPGNSLKILFNNIISPANPDLSTGWPGLYNGDPEDVNYNPLGWYAYKIVVKQTEQDYYNVYLPGVMAAYPNDVALELGKTSHTVLINDNINKIPRDLSEVGPAQKQFRSSVILYPRVNNTTTAYNNEQFYPGNTYAFASTIATNNSLFFPNGVYPTSPDPGFAQFYQIDSDPLITRISTVEELGVIATSDVINLAVYETKPVESKLDIYWETSTTGLISELNAAILAGAGPDNLASLSGWTFSLSEATAPETNVSGVGFKFKNIIGDDVNPTSVEIFSVFTLTGVNVTSKFVIETTVGTPNIYKIKTAPGAYFYYGFNAINAESYIFTIRATIGSPETSGTFVRNGNLTNVLPTITNKPVIAIDKLDGDIDVYDFDGLNGSNIYGPNSTLDLSWSVTGNPMFTITSGGLLQDLSGTAQGTFNLRVTLTEASGGTDFVDITVVYPNPQNTIFISNINTEPLNYTAIGSVKVNGSIVTLDPGYSFPVLNGGTVSGTYSIPITTPVTIEVNSINAVAAPVTLCINDLMSPSCTCQITNGYVEFTGLNLLTGPSLDVTLGIEGTTCP